ncbi:MAG: DUF3301 domain-containing protein [Chromatiales bacterium]|nr:DUF3301 domain-containing protein [Chromatiales bacterium]
MEITLLIVVLLLAWYWYSGAQAREQVVQAARLACERHDQSLLDETVLLERLRPRRDRSGRMRWQREYSFEFSGVGEQRRRGTVVLFGGRITDLQLQMEGGTLHDTH